MKLLADSRQIRRAGKRWVVDHTRTVDTRADPERSRALRSWWTRVALERAEHGHLNRSSFAVFNVSEKDLKEVAAMYREFYDRLRALVTRSEPCERVMLLTTQLVAIEAREHLDESMLDPADSPSRGRGRPAAAKPIRQQSPQSTL